MADPSADLPTDWWATADVLAYLAVQGARIERASWAAYVSRGQAPAADRTFGSVPAWRPDTVRTWHEGRRHASRADD